MLNGAFGKGILATALFAPVWALTADPEITLCERQQQQGLEKLVPLELKPELSRHTGPSPSPKRQTVIPPTVFFVSAQAHVIGTYQSVNEREVVGHRTPKKILSAKEFKHDPRVAWVRLKVDESSQELTIGSEKTITIVREAYEVGYPLPSGKSRNSKITQGLIKCEATQIRPQTVNSCVPGISPYGLVKVVVHRKFFAPHVAGKLKDLHPNVNFGPSKSLLITFLRSTEVAKRPYQSNMQLQTHHLSERVQVGEVKVMTKNKMD